MELTFSGGPAVPFPCGCPPPLSSARRLERDDGPVAYDSLCDEGAIRVPRAVRAGRTGVAVDTYRCEIPLEDGQWITVDGANLVVERVVPAKRGEPYDGLALCRLALG